MDTRLPIMLILIKMDIQRRELWEDRPPMLSRVLHTTRILPLPWRNPMRAGVSLHTNNLIIGPSNNWTSILLEVIISMACIFIFQ